MIGPAAPVRSTGPCSTGTPAAASSARTSAMPSSTMRQSSALPGVGRSAFGSNSFPAWCRLILLVSEGQRGAPGTEGHRIHAQDLRIEPDRRDNDVAAGAALRDLVRD